MNKQTRREFIKMAGLTAASAGVLSLLPGDDTAAKPSVNTKKKQPNIIFIMTDDQGPWAYSAYTNPNAKTPNIDRLCREGTQLKNYFITTPVCSPSRASLITGLYSTEVNIPDYLHDRVPELGLDPGLATWPKILSESGYATALIGKWHLGEKDKYHPTNYGYQEFAGFRLGGKISKDPVIEIDGREKQVTGYTPDILTDLAMDFVDRKKETPFLLSLHFWAPHANTDNLTPDGDRTWLPLSDADWNQFKNTDPVVPNPDYPNLDITRVKRMSREYFASVASVDRNLGKLLQKLDELRLSDNTIVIFTSDNGYHMGHNGIWHKGNGRWILTNNKGHRPNLWDNSLKVPAIIRWPGHVRPGKKIDRSIANFDWFPTILEMAGSPLPSNVKIRGRNFLPLLLGRNIGWNDDIFAQYSMWDWHQNGAILRCYRTPEWKIVRDFKHKGCDELYNLKLDPAETNNLFNSHEPHIIKVRENLNRKLLNKMREINDPALALIKVEKQSAKIST
ncbi:MAG: sulfatase-like hydrolase/transferase [Planctomycetota bacterium]|jgi:uncharacterized sulfatase